MKQTDKNYLIVYHAHCLDGITAAAVTYDYLTGSLDIHPNCIDTIAANYDAGFEDVASYLTNNKVGKIFIVDFSFKRDELLHLVKFVDCIELYDHHKTAFENLITGYKVLPGSKETFQIYEKNRPMNISVFLNNAESGASLVHKILNGYCEDKHLPRLVRYVKDYDLYQFKYTHTKAVNKWLKLQDKTIQRFTWLLEKFNDFELFRNATQIGNVLINHEENMENNIISKGTTTVTINGVTGLCCNAPYELASSIGDKLAEHSGTFGAIWLQLSGGVVKWSLRSVGDNCDVSALAKSMGGGGHKTAAGFSMSSPGYSDEAGITIWSNEVPEYPDE